MLQPRPKLPSPNQVLGESNKLPSPSDILGKTDNQEELKKKEPLESNVEETPLESNIQPTSTQPSLVTEKPTKQSELATSGGVIDDKVVPKVIYVNKDPKYGPVESIPKDIPYGTAYEVVKNSVQLKKWREQNIQEPNILEREGKKAIKGVNKFLDVLTNIVTLGTQEESPISIPGGDENAYQLARKVNDFRTNLPDYSKTADEEYQEAKSGGDWWQKTKEAGASALNFMADVITQSVRGDEKAPKMEVDSPLKKYEDDVLKNAAENNETLSQEEIDKRTEFAFKQDRISNLRQSDLNSFNYNLSPSEQKILQNYTSEQTSHLKDEQKKILSSIDITSAIANKSVSDFDKEIKRQNEIISGGGQVSEEDKNRLSILEKKATEDAQQLKYSQKKYFENTNNLGTFEQERDIFSKENNRIIDSFKRLNISLELLASGGVDFASYLSYSASLLPKNEVAGMLSNKLHGIAVGINRDVENTEKFLMETTNANTPEDYLNKILNFTFESAPMVALGATGVGGVVAMGATSAGQKFGEEYDSKGETWKKIVAPVLYGGAMMIPVAQGLKIVKHGKRVVSAIEPQLMKQTVSQYAKNAVKKVSKFGGESFDTAVAFKAQGVIQIVGVNHLILGKDIDYNELFDMKLYESAGFALLNKAVPLVMGMATKPFFSEKEYKIIDANSKKILELTKELDKATKEQKAITQDVINTLSKNSRDLIKSKLKQIESMSEPLQKKVIDTYVEQSKLRQEALVIKASRMSIENKKTALEVKQEEYREVSKLRNDINSGTYLEIDLPENKLKYESLAVKELIKENEGKSFDFKPEDVRKKAIELLDKDNKEKAKKAEEVKPIIEVVEKPEEVIIVETPKAEVVTPIAETAEAKVETPTAPESKIIDDKGDVIDFYHGTDSDNLVDFDITKARKGNNLLGKGFYFTNQEKEAGSYGKNVVKVELSSKNQLNLNDYINNKEYLKDPNIDKENINELDNFINNLKFDNNDDFYKAYSEIELYNKESKNTFKDYDSVRFDLGDYTEIRVNDKSQIKISEPSKTPQSESIKPEVKAPKIIEYNKQEYYKNEEGNWVNNKTGNEIKGIGVSGKGKALINALNIKEKNPTKKYKLTERGQAFNVEYKNGKLEVTKSDGSKVSKPYKLAVLRKHADNYDFTQGEKAMDRMDFEGQDWDNEVAKKSNNPAEVAEAVDYASFDDISNLTPEERVSFKDEIIFDGIGKIKEDGFDRFGDRNKKTDKTAKEYFDEEGRDIDDLAAELSDSNGIEVSPNDIAEFIERHPNGKKEFKVKQKENLTQEQITKNNKVLDLKNKFTELTGLPATNEFLLKAVKQAARKFAGHDTLDQLSDAQLEAKYNELKQFEEQQYGKQAEKVIEPTKRVDEVKDTKDTGEVQEGVEKVEPVLSKTDEAFRDKIRDIPNSGLVGKYLSGETIERVEGETPRNKQDIEVLNLVEAGNHGKETIEMAKEKYGDKYIEKTLEFLESTNLKSHEKAIVYISLENELFDAVKAEPDNLGLKKLQDLVRAKSQALGREGSLTINAGRLRAIMKDGFDVSQVTDKFLSDAELRDKSNVEKAIQSNAEEIQKEYEEQESNILEGENERPIYTQKDFDAELQKAKDELGKNYDISVFENLKRQARKDKLSDIKEDLKLAKEKVLEDIRKVVRESRSEMSVNPISKPIEFTALVAKLAKIYIQEGALSLEEVANNIYNDLKDMSKDISKESIINALKSKPKRVMSEATKRKIYISLLNKSIESLDTQIQAKKRNIVTNTDKYKRDAEIKELRNKRDGKKEELAKIDPSYAESRKLETDLKLAQNSLEEYQRRIDENDLTPREKEPKIVAEKLKKLRQLRDTKKKEYLAKKKKFEDSLKEPAILPTKEELENKKYLSEVDSKIKSLNKRIEDLKENKQKDTYGKSTVWNEKISELENELKDLRESKKKYLSEDEISELKINAKLKERQKVLEDLIENKEKDVLGKSSYWSAEISKVNAEIKKLRESKKEYLSEEESAQQRIDKKLIQREKVLADLIEGKKKDVTGKKSDWSSEISRVNAEIQRLRDLKKQKGSKELSNKEVVNNALIEAGFGKEITVKTKAGKVKRTVLDWRKLAGEEGSIDKIKENVEKIIGEEAAKDLEAEYNNLRARIIEKSLNELENRNTPRSPVSIKTSAKKLAELYNYGMFEKDPDSYDNLLNTALGMSKLNQENFIEAKKLAGKLSELFSQKDSKGNQISQENLKHAERVINRQIENLLSKIAWSDSNGVYKATIVAKEYIGLAQRNALVSAGQAVENTTSGYISRIFKKIGFAFDNVDTKSLRQSRNALEKMTFKDITLNGGLEFGDVTSPFITKSKTQDLIVNASDSQIYHALASTALGKPFLESADSMHKSALAQGYFHYNLIKILRKKGYSKDEAKNYVSEKLTGQSFEDALVTSKQIIDKINEGSDKKIIPDTKESIYRFANDLVNEALIQGNKITLKELEASLKSAETVAGFELGHEPNNVFSKPLNLLNSWVQVKVDRAVKQKEWNNAAALTSASIISQNVLNPYVGGGTNWMFLAAQKTGIPTASTFYWNIRARGSKLDLSSESGIKNLEQTLKYQLLAKNANIRMFVGATVSLSAFALFKSTGADDDLYQWLKKNEWANKYFKKIAPPALQFMIAQKNKELGNFLANQMNIKIDAFDEGKKIKRAIDNAASGKTKKALGGVGQLVGSRLNTPIIPWRVVKDARDVYRGLNGLEPVKSDYKTSGFWNGYFQGGMIEQIGLRPEKDKVKVTPKTQEEMEKSMREAMKKVSEQMKKERRQ